MPSSARGSSNSSHRAAQAALDRFVADREAPGVAYVVVDRDGFRFQGSAGMRDAAQGDAISSDTLFMACSTTKALTAIATMQLVEERAIALEAPLSRYFRDHPYGDGVTIRTLLAHTSGVPNPAPLDWFYLEDESRRGREELARVLRTAGKLRGAPGKRYGYSNLGYWLLGAAIEETTGRSYAEVVADQIFEPLGVGEDEATFTLPSTDRLARGHMRAWSLMSPVFRAMTPRSYWKSRASGWHRIARLEMHGAAYGGLFATPTALARVLGDLLRPEGVLLSEATREIMWSPQTTTKGKPTGDALGWVVGALDGHRYVGKQGGALGFFGNARVYPDAGVATVYFANATRVTPRPIDAVSDRLDRLFLGDAEARRGSRT